MKFEESKDLQCACIYKLPYPDGKCYIGQTKCLALIYDPTLNSLS